MSQVRIMVIIWKNQRKLFQFINHWLISIKFLPIMVKVNVLDKATSAILALNDNLKTIYNDVSLVKQISITAQQAGWWCLEYYFLQMYHDIILQSISAGLTFSYFPLLTSWLFLYQWDPYPLLSGKSSTYAQGVDCSDFIQMVNRAQKSAKDAVSRLNLPKVRGTSGIHISRVGA